MSNNKVVILDGRFQPYSNNNPLPISGNISASAGADELAKYIVHDLEEPGASITYIGKEKNDGTYLVLKMDETSGLVIRYANLSNNGGSTTYATAWTNRATLNYDYLENLTGL